jgi:Ni,Fe-hydrogenase III large subunit/Ni,Fe-hydrogenase III component G
VKLIIEKAEGVDSHSEPWPKTGGARYLPVSETDCYDTLAGLAGKDVVLIDLFCVENFTGSRGYTLFYVLEKRDRHPLVVLQYHLNSSAARSVARLFPSASWFEREVRDGFGVDFPDAFDKRRLFLHECYPPEFHPLRKDFRNQPISPLTEIPTDQAYPFKEISGGGVYQIPVGPVHAGVIESGHFRFGVMGETIFNLEIRHFYKHRGLENLAENRKPVECVAIAESISGDESACNATAFSMAIEDINDCTVSKRAWEIRTILLEMERIYSHLGDMAGMQVDVAYPIGASPLFILREEILRYNAILTGSRFLKGMIIPGGLKQNIPFDKLKALNEYMVVFTERFEEAVKTADESSWVIDRFETTGIVSNKLIAPLNLTGPVARASGACIDTRHDHPYGIYSRLEIEIPVKQDGDVLSRFQVKAAEICNSIEIIRDIIKQIHQSEIYTPCLNKDGYALAVVEAPRGQNIHWVYVKNGLIDRYKVRTASFCNWLAIEHAVLGNIVPDFPVINKSMNLSYAGNDL